MSIKQRISKTTGISDQPTQTFEDTSFVTGDSPVTLDCNVALGRNAIEGYVANDGLGSFTVAFSLDGTSYGDENTLKKSEIIEFSNWNIDSIRITWIADSAYRVSVV